ncbi:unnamed protein product [Sphagnum balticum]
MSAEVELRISGTPDPTKPTIPCGAPSAERPCPCPGNNTWYGPPDWATSPPLLSSFFCGFCKNFKRTDIVSNVNIQKANNNNPQPQTTPVDPGPVRVNIKTPQGSQCECDTVSWNKIRNHPGIPNLLFGYLQVEEGVYDIEAEVCTPPEDQLRQNIPTNCNSMWPVVSRYE